MERAASRTAAVEVARSGMATPGLNRPRTSAPLLRLRTGLMSNKARIAPGANVVENARATNASTDEQVESITATAIMISTESSGPCPIERS